MNDIELNGYFDVACQAQDISGDIVECGVYRGESLGAITRGMRGRRVWAYDSFQGFPKGNPAYDDEVALGLEGALVGDIEEVKRNVEPHAKELIIREGWFEDTFSEPLPVDIAFLSIDCDLFDSVLLSLLVMAPRVVSGGIITIDDWSAFVGARKAFYEWMRMSRRWGAPLLAPLLTTFGTGQVWWRV